MSGSFTWLFILCTHPNPNGIACYQSSARPVPLWEITGSGHSHKHRPLEELVQISNRACKIKNSQVDQSFRNVEIETYVPSFLDL